MNQVESKQEEQKYEDPGSVKLDAQNKKKTTKKVEEESKKPKKKKAPQAKRKSRKRKRPGFFDPTDAKNMLRRRQGGQFA